METTPLRWKVRAAVVALAEQVCDATQKGRERDVAAGQGDHPDLGEQADRSW